MASFGSKIVRVGLERQFKAGRESAPPYRLSQRSVHRRREAVEALDVPLLRPRGVRSREASVGGVPGRWVEPEHGGHRTVVYLHGGGYMLGSSVSHLSVGGRIARRARARVFLPDYRRSPEHPFPAAWQDACAVMRAFDDSHVGIAGDSAGGGLALAAALTLADEGKAPAALAVVSPWTDLALTGASMKTRVDVDPMCRPGDMCELVHYYLGPNGDARDPRISPLYGDLSRLPPTLILVGDDEMLLDDARRVARRAGDRATLEVWPQMFHVWPIFSPLFAEARAGLRRMADFLAVHV